MKGDAVEVFLAVGDKVEKVMMLARKAGQSVVVDRPRQSTTVSVIVQDRNGNPQQTLTAQASSVIATIEKPLQKSEKSK